ncbi:GNAT family N-acetyltransferase [Butyrivibrio sp. INlla14]|uniref:GNAT family N-acetyltransferase n=1 Tax=Butyrivibrio sp. INlla14 TaxID=1520808 RepID=UPI0008766E4F|nr:GNAT family N-acetyltransferase [Butyrivibrio sp. INlla14]SCX85053.1 aminoglycoside 6'-N-acetyltransferase I [Butyrivibrio sp. INlla14]
MTVLDLDETYLEKIKELFQSVFSAPPWNEDWDDDQLDNYIRELMEVRQPIFYGLFEGDELIGMSLGRVKHWCGGTEYFIEEFCIRRDYQDKGNGKKFLSLIEEKIKAQGLNTIFLMTERTQPAYEFYKHIGFTEHPDLTAFVKEL